MTKEIPSDEWISFLDSFSLQHQGWLVAVEVIAPEIGAQEEASNLPLEGFSESNEQKTISISVGSVPSNHLTHTVNEGGCQYARKGNTRTRRGG